MFVSIRTKSLLRNPIPRSKRFTAIRSMHPCNYESGSRNRRDLDGPAIDGEPFQKRWQHVTAGLLESSHELLERNADMLNLALTFLVIALLAGLFGFGLVGGMAYGAARICFFIFLVLAVLSLLTGRRVRVD